MVQVDTPDFLSSFLYVIVCCFSVVLAIAKLTASFPVRERLTPA
jgi:hypothetical protein